MRPARSILPGQPYPLGANIRPGGVNLSVYSRNARRMDVLLFDDCDDPEPAEIITLDPAFNRTFTYWHAFIPEIGHGQVYGLRAFGPYAPFMGHRYDPGKLLLDPYARAVYTPRNYDRRAAAGMGDNTATAMRSVIVDPRAYKWEGDQPLQVPYSRSVIYEMHVGGFTKHPSSGLPEEQRGTYAGLIEKIPYLKSLGITAVELMPVQHFDAQDAPPGLTNYWGYSPVAFFAPHAAYSSRPDPLGAVDEFRDMVKALHRAGLEVILDVVFNHTGEGDASGPTLSLRGLENRAYYMLDWQHPALYRNFSGTGNTINANHSVVRRMIMDCLRYWVQSMHVDGFRFDLASVLARDEDGNPQRNPPILWEIESDPVLAGAKIIAEAWDAGGLYQVGTFIGHRWSEWNGRFRDDARRFLIGADNSVVSFANRLTGSPDLYYRAERDPNRSINFITCHDGFTLYDWTSYNTKHNLANKQNNRDGSDDNLSWNCGVEGPTDDPGVLATRQRQMRNALLVTLISQGTPMLLMGDEIAHSQDGNNNAYCQDNELSWLDWEAMHSQAGLLRFTRLLVQFTNRLAVLSENVFWTSGPASPTPRIAWHGVRQNRPDYAPHSHSLAFELLHAGAGEHLYLAFNAWSDALEFDIPSLPAGQGWRRIVDTSLESPQDIHPLEEAPRLVERQYILPPRSALMLFAMPA